MACLPSPKLTSMAAPPSPKPTSAQSPSPEPTSVAYSPSESTSTTHSPSESISMAYTPALPDCSFSSTASMAQSSKGPGSSSFTTSMAHSSKGPRSSSFSSAASMATSISSCEGNSFRVFLVQTAKGLESPSGGYKANISLMRYLVSRGHTVRQICQPSRGEVETYIQKVAISGGRDPEHHTRQIHLRTVDGETGTDIRVDSLIMEDGVQIVGIEDEGVTMAFGGKENYHDQLTTDTAAYIEVQLQNISFVNSISCQELTRATSLAWTTVTTMRRLCLVPEGGDCGFCAHTYSFQ